MHRYFGFAIATLRLFQHPENVKISIFPFTLFQQKCHISSKYLTNFLEVFFRWKKRNMAIVVKIARAQMFWFCNRNVTTFPTSRKCKNFNFFLYTVPAEMLYLHKYLTNSQNLFLRVKEEKRGYCGWKFQVHRYFGFAIATSLLFQPPENVKNLIFSLTQSRQKSYISRSI